MLADSNIGLAMILIALTALMALAIVEGARKH